MAKKPQMQLRKMHERQLRTLSYETAKRMRDKGINVPEIIFQSATARRSNGSVSKQEEELAKLLDPQVADAAALMDAFSGDDGDGDVDTGASLHDENATAGSAAGRDDLVNTSTDITLAQLRLRRSEALNANVQLQLKYASSILAFFQFAGRAVACRFSSRPVLLNFSRRHAAR